MLGSIFESRLYDMTCFLGSCLSTGLQVYLSKCWYTYLSPGCMIWLGFLWVFLICFSMLILSLLLLWLGFKSIYLSPGFCAHRPRQYDRICWELDLISGFFAFSWLILWVDGINKYGWCLARGRGSGWQVEFEEKIPRVSGNFPG